VQPAKTVLAVLLLFKKKLRLHVANKSKNRAAKRWNKVKKTKRILSHAMEIAVAPLKAPFMFKIGTHLLICLAQQLLSHFLFNARFFL
jgi:hypothetical protein